MLQKAGVRATAAENIGRLAGARTVLRHLRRPLCGHGVPHTAPRGADGYPDHGAGLRRQKRRKKAVGEKIDSCADLAVGDLVVHEQHGIGRFAGVVRIPVDGAEKDY